MLFWTLAAVLTAGALGLALAPLLRAPRVARPALDHDRALYRARLTEIDADLALGRLSPAEAEAARAEEGRRLLRLSGGGEAALPRTLLRRPSLPHQGMARGALLAGLVVVPALAIAGYLSLGAPDMPDQAFASRAQPDLREQGIEELLARAEAQLARNPDDLRGWAVIAPIYLRMGRADDAQEAFRNAMRLEPSNPDWRTAWAEARVFAGGGAVDAAAREQLEAALRLRPGDHKARYYLALGLGQTGPADKAAEAWRALIADAPADAPWLTGARAQLAALETPAQASPVQASQTPAQTSTNAAPGPDAEDVAAAAELGEGDRRAMIEGMVARLAERLETAPDDADGWLRLIRSYRVLGRTAEAEAASARARSQFSGREDILARIAAVEAGPAAGGLPQ